MDTSAFLINFSYKGKPFAVEIRPCCKEDNVVDYAIWENGKLLFTITREYGNHTHWVIALKNSDDDFDDEMIQDIGNKIDQKEKAN